MTPALPDVLTTAAELVETDLRKALSQLDEDTRKLSEYHFGWVFPDGSPNKRGGKALRPALVLLSAQVVGGEYDKPLPAAAAVELVHNFSLLHDDLMDRDTSRRHRPTAWTVFGSSPALLAGDALLTLATEVLLDGSSPHAASAARSLSAATTKLIAGQSADLDFEYRVDVTLDECRRMTEGKTGALLACAASIGALYVGAPRETVSRLHAFGSELGMAFQLVDDLLGLWGEPEVTGKPVLSDLRMRKKSLPIVHAMTSGTGAGQQLRRLYAQPEPLSEAQVQEAADMVQRAGSRDWAQSECEHRLLTAEHHLRATGHQGGAIDSLVELAEFIVRRKR